MLKKIKDHISNLGNKSIETSDQEQIDTEIINNACAALLIETALADKVFNEDELTSMQQTLKNVYKVNEKDIEELINESKKKVSESTSLYEYTRLINDFCDYEDKIRLINNLWSIAFADQQLDKYEEHLIRKISDLVHISHGDYINIKLKVRDS